MPQPTLWVGALCNMTDIISTLEGHLGVSKRHSRGEYYFHCPFCHHKNKKLAINIHKGAWHCWVCNARGRTLVSLCSKLKIPYNDLGESINANTFESEDTYTETVCTLPEECEPLSTTIEDYGIAIAYLWKRDVRAFDIKRYSIGYCSTGKYAKRIIIPSFDASGTLNYFVARSINESKFPYMLPPVSKNIVAFESYIDWSQEVILCEGVFDAMAIRRNAIPLLGNTLGSTLLNRLTEYRPPICIALDSDAIANALSICVTLEKRGLSVRVAKFPEKDPSVIGFKKMRKYIREAQSSTFSQQVLWRLYPDLF